MIPSPSSLSRSVTHRRALSAKPSGEPWVVHRGNIDAGRLWSPLLIARTKESARISLPRSQFDESTLDYGRYTGCVSKTFYIETFGCQMNAHDSEKVIGTLEQQGYARVEDEAEAGLILYKTCW